MLCPACKADNAQGPACRRCKADLSPLWALEARREALLALAGTIHTHWNPSTTEPLRFIELIVAKEGQDRSVPRP